MTSTTIDVAPGQQITCTVTKAPANTAQEKTIARLMRRDPAAVRSLRRAQHLRRKRMHTYIRGNRLYYSRERPAKVVRVEVGRQWSFAYTPDLAADLASVAGLLDVKSS